MHVFVVHAMWERQPTLFHCMTTPQVRAMVLDSPFQDFWVLAMELVSKIEIKIPSVAISVVRMLIRNSTKSRANVDMDKLSPISGIHGCVPQSSSNHLGLLWIQCVRLHLMHRCVAYSPPACSPGVQLQHCSRWARRMFSYRRITPRRCELSSLCDSLVGLLQMALHTSNASASRYEKHNGAKQLAIFPGDHNSMRSKRWGALAS